MNKKLQAMALTGLLFFGLTSPGVFAQMPDDGPGMGPPDEMSGPPPERHSMGKHGGGMMAEFKELNLTEDQKAKLKQQRESGKKEMKTLRDQMMTEREKMISMMFDPNATKAQMYAQQEKVNALQSRMGKMRIDHICAFKEILTAEQKEKLKKIGAEKQAKMKQMKQKFQERRNKKNKE